MFATLRTALRGPPSVMEKQGKDTGILARPREVLPPMRQVGAVSSSFPTRTGPAPPHPGPPLSLCQQALVSSEAAQLWSSSHFSSGSAPSACCLLCPPAPQEACRSPLGHRTQRAFPGTWSCPPRNEEKQPPSRLPWVSLLLSWENTSLPFLALDFILLLSMVLNCTVLFQSHAGGSWDYALSR